MRSGISPVAVALFTATLATVATIVQVGAIVIGRFGCAPPSVPISYADERGYVLYHTPKVAHN